MIKAADHLINRIITSNPAYVRHLPRLNLQLISKAPEAARKGFARFSIQALKHWAIGGSASGADEVVKHVLVSVAIACAGNDATFCVVLTDSHRTCSLPRTYVLGYVLPPFGLLRLCTGN
jgi:hypothetical protein